MKTGRAASCMAILLLLIITGYTAGVSSEWKPDTQSGCKEQPAPGNPKPVIQEEHNPPVIPDKEDDTFYVQCLQNLHQGNNITYADGYYYFRSQTKEYALCRTKGAGMPVEVLADQIPGSIYVRENQVYFINVSDNRTLYRVGTDGSGLEKLSDFPMQELIVLEDKIYFRSVYEREYDPFYQLTEEAAGDDRYLYSMNLDGTGCTLLLPKVCMEFVSDGEALYYLVFEDGYVLYKNGLDGKAEEKILQKEDRIWNILPYRGDFYWVDGKQNQLVRLNKQGEEEILSSDVQRFTIARGQIYVVNERELRKTALDTGQECLLAERVFIAEENGYIRTDTHPWYAGSYNRGIFLVNGQVFAKFFESAQKGVLWHILDGETFSVFEDMEPLQAKELVLDSSLLYECNYYYPGIAREDVDQYLDAGGEFHYEESFGIREDGLPYGNFSVTLPKFNEKLESYRQMNQQMEELLELALEDKEVFFQEIGELDQDQWISWRREHGYSHLYVGESYISMYYYREGYEGGMREWNNAMPLIFDRKTGCMLHMDDLFTVEERVYQKRLTAAVYKFCEMTGNDWWNDAFDNNVLVKKMGDLRSYLTSDGMVLCYERCEVQAGCSGRPTFEIPYEWFADIFKQ